MLELKSSAETESQHPSKFLHAIGFQLPQGGSPDTQGDVGNPLSASAPELTVPWCIQLHVHHTHCSSPHGTSPRILSCTALQNSKSVSSVPSPPQVLRPVVVVLLVYLLTADLWKSFSCCLALKTLLALMLLSKWTAYINSHDVLVFTTLSRFELCGKTEDLEFTDLHTPLQSPPFTQAYV